ncbi:MAG: glycerophosphodiester phosphodiesterase [Bullifex sp.]
MEFNDGKPLILGHRGLPTRFRENTIPSFRGAVDAGADGIELDIHLTKDMKLAVIHDHNTKRTTGVDMDVEKAMLAELQEADREIVTLDDVFDEFGDSLIYDIELKEKPFAFSPIAEMALETMRRHNLEDRIMVSSFNPFTVRAFRRLESGIPAALIYDMVNGVPRPMRRGQGRMICHPDFLKPGVIIAPHQARKLKVPFSVWCVDTKEEMQRFAALGAFVIITNRADELLK